MVGFVRTLKTVCAWVSFSFAGALNGLLIWLILKHTPRTMRVYSKVLCS
jgi:hypothetical protein